MALSGLPDELCRHVALFLPAPDVLRLLMINQSLATHGRSEILWRSLLARDAGVKLPTMEASSTVEAQKRAYLTYAHIAELSMVQWYPVHSRGEPSAREGHLMCILGTPSSRKVIVTGGFCVDSCIHLLPLFSEEQRWTAIRPLSTPSFVYGATLTALDEQRAVRFGGFCAGGYSAETNEVCVLTLTQDDDGRDVAHWESKVTSGCPAVARAYHSATLVHDRYLVIIGGMTTRGSVLQEAILDTQTWTWVDKNISNPMGSMKPSGRHGHSVVLDARRNRLVLFGGGSGSDLLRSGEDNTEVWELCMGNDGVLESSLPWDWRKIYCDAREGGEDEIEDHDEEQPLASGLSPAECLVLGRCHVGVLVTVDKVLLAFGSGHPTTNGVLAYDLSTDMFHRPEVSGPLPVPRFTAAAAVLDKEGWLITHGGYTTQVNGARGDTIVLDLAPAMKRIFPALQAVGEEDQRVLSYREIGDADVQPSHAIQMDNSIGAMPLALSAYSREGRRDAASRMLSTILAGGGMGGRAALILSMVANGSAVIGDDDDSGEDFDDDDDVMSSNL